MSEKTNNLTPIVVLRANEIHTEPCYEPLLQSMLHDYSVK